MSRLLINLLGADSRRFKEFVDRLEHVCLNPAVDIKLSAEILTKTRERARALGLDLRDTTHAEFYHGLQAKLMQDDAELKKVLKLEKANPMQLADRFAKAATSISKSEHVLAMTNGGAKRVLEAVPPKKTMRLLKLRSLTSVLKREDARVLFALATQIEDASWRSQAHARMKRLQVNDIAWQAPSVLVLPHAWLEKAEAKIGHHGIQMICPDVGAVVLLPVMKGVRPGASVLALGLMLQAAQRLAIESTPYRRQSFMLGYHEVLPEIAHGKQPPLEMVYGLSPSWAVLYELLGKGHYQDVLHDTEFNLNDLNWQTTEMKLASLVPAMDFWVGTHYLGLKTGEGKPISLHVLDVARSLLVKSKLGTQSTTHLEGALWNELQLRYLQQDALMRAVTRQLQQSNGAML